MNRDTFIKSYDLSSKKGRISPGVVVGVILIALDILLMSGFFRFGALHDQFAGTPMEHFVPGPKMGLILTTAGLAMIILGLMPDRYTGMDLYYDGLIFHRPKGEDEPVDFDKVDTIITSQQGRGFDKTLFIRFENGKNRQILLPEHSTIPEDVEAAWTSYCRAQNRLIEEEEERERSRQKAQQEADREEKQEGHHKGE
ncbi:MAG: hypothetical protein IJU30_07355 [Lachnospiraceae bacterium]|nr:hypothetical protein [Lachnospiraceae bacterium]